jgi:hypothetical protein
MLSTPITESGRGMLVPSPTGRTGVGVLVGVGLVVGVGVGLVVGVGVGLEVELTVGVKAGVVDGD